LVRALVNGVVTRWCPRSERHRGVQAHVARAPRSFPTSTHCAAGFTVSPFCSPAISIISLGRRVVRTGTPPWRVVHQRGLGARRHRLPSNHRSGLRCGFAVLIGLRVVLVFRPDGWHDRSVPTEAAPARAGASGTGSLRRQQSLGTTV
jgi:hypothetical protein